MTSISNVLYTQQASSNDTSPVIATESPLTVTKEGAAGLFDLLMASLLSAGATSVNSVTTTPSSQIDPQTDPTTGLATSVVDSSLPTGDTTSIIDGVLVANTLAMFTAELKDQGIDVTVMTPTPRDTHVKSDTTMTTALQAQIAATKTTDDSGHDMHLAQQTLATSPDVGDDVLLNKQAGHAITTPTGPAAANTEPNDSMAAQLNAMIIGGSDKEKSGKTDKPIDVLSALTKSLDNTQGNGYQPTLTSSAKAYTPGSKAQSALIPASPITAFGTTSDSITTDTLTAWSDPMVTSASLAQTTLGSVKISSHNSSVSGSQAHAAVQSVAMHLQSLGQNRETKSLTLQLNPPELGKLQIKMTFGSDKKVRTDILVEKLDTYNLMQKDSDTLKNALADAGLQADAGSLNFTLADQGTFAHANDNGPSDPATKTFGEEGDVVGAYEIKASEEWSVDPSTGIVRYNIWV